MAATSDKSDDKQVLSWTGSVNINSGAATSENLAEMFNPGRPMVEPGVAKEKWKIWMDVPEELQKVLRKKMKRIGLDCLKQNAEIVLDLFQDMIIKHVLGMQIHNKTLSRIIRGNPEIDDKSDDPPDIEPIAGKIAKSSLLGQDPWGDKELPAKTPRDSAEEAEESSAYSADQALLNNNNNNIWS